MKFFELVSTENARTNRFWRTGRAEPWPTKIQILVSTVWTKISKKWPPGPNQYGVKFSYLGSKLTRTRQIFRFPEQIGPNYSESEFQTTFKSYRLILKNKNVYFSKNWTFQNVNLELGATILARVLQIIPVRILQTGLYWVKGLVWQMIMPSLLNPRPLLNHHGWTQTFFRRDYWNFPNFLQIFHHFI